MISDTIEDKIQEENEMLNFLYQEWKFLMSRN